MRRRWIPVALVALAGLVVLMIPRVTGSTPALAGTVLPARAAPAFQLRDQFGRGVSLAQFRGHPVVITFVEAHCTTLCQTVAERIRWTNAGLGPAGNQIAILAVSTYPEGDSTAAMQSFSRRHGMLYRWHYLTGTRSVLTRVWRSYYVYAAPPSAPAQVRDAHTSATYLIDAAGRERVLFGGDPDPGVLDRDLRILSGLDLQGQSVASVPMVGDRAPDFRLPGLQGQSVRLSSLRGKVVLVNFWATWCQPCRSEVPRLSRWYRAQAGRGLVVLGVDQQEGRKDVAAFARRFHVPYPLALDEDTAVLARYNVAGLPTSVLVDRQGVIAAEQRGAVSDAWLKAHVDRLLAGAAG